eukprot:TRINITY_DN242_c0_g1_i2.p1 TRINITY_DN242_c0_g1~~TRINITY_DN242_c0_g1_i2.p1  ORF type:complete len:139 (+),score=58.39 TRINITY_DN242_c0_g1_i2:116-532(+)
MSQEENDKLRLNLEQLEEASTGDLEFQVELLDMFKEQVELSMDSLMDALSSEDKQSILYSHDIKGSASNLGLELVRRLAEKSEFACKKAQYKMVLDEIYPLLQEEIIETTRVIDSYIESVTEEEGEEGEEEEEEEEDD